MDKITVIIDACSFGDDDWYISKVRNSAGERVSDEIAINIATALRREYAKRPDLYIGKVWGQPL